MRPLTICALFKLLLCVFLFLAFPGIPFAAEYYVSTTGNDTKGDGTIGNPYRTIQYVLDSVAISGDTITLRGGTYNEAVRIRNPNMTIRSRSGE